MRALAVITGRGLGGDAVNALNIIQSLEDKGIECEIALDSKAPGRLFKKHGYSWHKISIPQAGGFAATKFSSLKAALKMFSASLKIRKLIRKLGVDFVVGIIGGGAIVGCFGAKISGVPAYGYLGTPLDIKVCRHLNEGSVTPETHLFKEDVLPEGLSKSYFPIDPSISYGKAEKALDKIKEFCQENNLDFDENKKTILFSSGSSIFKGIIDGLVNFEPYYDDYNILLIGFPLKEEYLELVNTEKIIYLGYIDWLKDLYAYLDLAVITDDGLMAEEAVACGLPAVTLTRVKYGRYHNMEAIFKGALIESDLDELNEKIEYALDNLDSIKEASKKYSSDILNAKSDIADKILESVNK